MEKVRRIYVEKKEPFAVKAKELHEDLKSYLGMDEIVVKVMEVKDGKISLSRKDALAELQAKK